MSNFFHDKNNGADEILAYFLPLFYPWIIPRLFDLEWKVKKLHPYTKIHRKCIESPQEVNRK